MSVSQPSQVFLAHAPENREVVDAIARKLSGDARLQFWYVPWHSVPGVPVQEQMGDALLEAQACAVFIGGGSNQIVGWQNEQMRTAIQTHVEDGLDYRVIPVLLGAVKPAAVAGSEVFPPSS